MGQKWFYSDNGQEAGPFSLDQLKWLVANKRLSPDDLVWSKGMPDWVRAAEVRDLFSADKAIRIKPPPLPKSASGLQQPISQSQQAPGAPASHPQAPMQAKPVSRPAAKATSAQFAASSGIGTITVCRRPKLAGFIYSLKVSADGQPVGEIPGGVLDLLAGRERELEFHLPSGEHSIEVAGGGLKGATTVNVPADRDISLVTCFSNLGILGGGLTITEEGVVRADVLTRLRGSQIVIATCLVSVATVALCCGVGRFLTLAARRNSTESQTLPSSHPRPDDNNSKRISLADTSVPEALRTFFENALTTISVVNEIPGLPQPTTGPHGEPLLKKKESLTDDRVVRLEYTCFYQGGDPDKDLMHGYARSWYKNGRVNQLTFYNNGLFTAEIWWASDGLSRNVVMRDRAGYYHMAVVNMRPNGGRESTKKAISATNKTVRGTDSIEWVSEVEIRYHLNGAPWRVCRWRHGRPIDNITYNADGSLDGSAIQFIDGTFFDRGMAPLHVR